MTVVEERFTDDARDAMPSPDDAPDERAAVWARAHKASALEREVAELRNLVSGMERSLSWRITSPLRAAKATSKRATVLARRAREKLKAD